MTSRTPPASDDQTFRRMSRQRQKDTQPEVLVRRALHRLGHRFRVDNRDLPGSPDIANRKRRWAIFVHGCYWHAHEGCPRHTIPKRNRDFWEAKFGANRERDERAVADLESLGFHTVTLWECEVADHLTLASVLTARLSRSGE